MRAVADRLGMDPDALKKALDGGSTMSSLAAQLAQVQNRGALVDGYV
jgi:2-hydroxychromene-2-carboxylate isomerase